MPSSDPLRQGDLLKEVPLPKLKLPLDSIKSGTYADAGLVTVKPRTVLVVSHCCNTSDNYVAVAPLVNRKNLTVEQEVALLAEEPPEQDDEGRIHGYMVEYFRVAPLSPHLSDLGKRSQWVADLGSIVSFSGRVEELLGQRVGRLDVPSRRLLRLNLSLFWSRLENEDAQELTRLGLPHGFSSPPALPNPN